MVLQRKSLLVKTNPDKLIRRETARGQRFIKRILSRATKKQIEHVLESKDDAESLLRLAELAVVTWHGYNEEIKIQ
jgi:hypothetical protein